MQHWLVTGTCLALLRMRLNPQYTSTIVTMQSYNGISLVVCCAALVLPSAVIARRMCCTGTALVLHWLCTVPMPGLYLSCTDSYCTGTTLRLRLRFPGRVLVLRRPCAGTVLVIGSTGTALVLH